MSRVLARFPLRVTIAALLVAITGFGLVAAGASAVIALRTYLTSRLDTQLIENTGRLSGFAGHNDLHEDSRGPGRDGDGGGPREFFVRYVSADGTGYVDMATPSEDGVPDIPVWTINDAPRTPVTIGSLGSSWRVMTAPLRDGSGYVLVAQSLDEIDGTLARLILLELVIGVIILAAVAALGYVLVRWTLRPLAEVERTAHDIAAGASDGTFTDRVPEGDPRSEVGGLAASFNAMIDRIDTAFREREASEAEARASERRMRRFVADASHELRTPLTTIRGFAELYTQGADSPQETHHAMRRIEEASVRMGVLVEDLLLLARLDQQRPLEQRPVDLLDLAASTRAEFEAAYSGRTVDLQVTLTEPAIVTGDALRLRQVLDNLVANALQHTSGAVRIILATGDGTAKLSVSDEGPGLTPADAERVFERFYRTDESRNSSTGGSGLGLAIVRSLVLAHEGSVDLSTSADSGSTFTISLPLTGGAQEEVSADPADSGTVES
jgi:two-component system OmpR family sensor kinase